MKTKYRIVRRWTTKTNKVTGEIVEQSEDRFYIQYWNLFTILFEGGWKDLHLFGFNTLKDAQDDLDRRLKKKSIKEVEHQKVEVKI
jgi:hypothetical protein